MAKKIVICGAGFGGLELSSRLSATFFASAGIARLSKNICAPCFGIA